MRSGYAADGYARVKGMSAIVTTFGVGEVNSLRARGLSEHQSNYRNLALSHQCDWCVFSSDMFLAGDFKS
jgi:hypothetical protein